MVPTISLTSFCTLFYIPFKLVFQSNVKVYTEIIMAGLHKE